VTARIACFDEKRAVIDRAYRTTVVSRRYWGEHAARAGL